jgi:hypothetical protein
MPSVRFVAHPAEFPAAIKDVRSSSLLILLAKSFKPGDDAAMPAVL